MNVVNRTTKLRWRRNFRRKQRRLENIGSEAEQQLDRHFFRRLGRLYEVRRFIVSWLLLIVLLGGLTVVQTRALGSYYQSVKPLPGGIYSEGLVGNFTNANPIFAAGEADSAVSRLLFASLLMYDTKGQLVGDLASGYTVDATGKIYTVTLKNNLVWQDNKPLTAEDVLFTLQEIQNPDTKSPLFAAWQGIKVAATDSHTVTFTLANVLASFPYSLTVGVLPKHVLATVDPSSLRSALFNTTEPIGSGPFKWHGVEVQGDNVENHQQRVSLSANARYYKGKPKINEFVLRTFLNETQMMASFNNGELTAMAGVQDLPDNLKSDLNLGQYSMSVTGEVLAFMNTTGGVLTDVQVRRALVSAIDPRQVLLSLDSPRLAVKSPLLRGMVGYDPAIVQRPSDASTANTVLDAAGWVKSANGIRAKAGKPLKLMLSTLNTMEYTNVAHSLQKQWRQVGVELTVTSLSQSDLQGAISDRGYDILLYGVSLGNDPDQFAYWHSSQADKRSQRHLNFSNYSSKVADASLEAGRTRTDVTLRAAKYKPFLEAWRDDAPALALYQPRLLYVSHGPVFNFNATTITTNADRYVDVQNWMIRAEHRTNE